MTNEITMVAKAIVLHKRLLQYCWFW